MTSTKRLNAHMKVAQAYAELSHAKRLKVGAVLVREDRPVAVGYNGTPSGADNNCEEAMPHLNMLDQVTSVEYVTKPSVVHAEMNVIAFAARSGVSTDGCIMVITDSPCYECSKLIIQAGITEVYYLREYRLTESLEFLRENGVKVEQYKEKGRST